MNLSKGHAVLQKMLRIPCTGHSNIEGDQNVQIFIISCTHYKNNILEKMSLSGHIENMTGIGKQGVSYMTFLLK